MTLRVRFAPSPSGDLHVGGARTALFNWLYAHKTQGTYIFRIEDSDADRSDDASIRSIADSLKWLGLNADEGEGVGGACAPYRQSQALELYRAEAETLIQAGRAYWCYDTEAEQEAERQHLQHHPEQRKNRHPHRGLAQADQDKLLAEGRKPALRFATDDLRGVVEWDDMVRGPINVNLDEIRDFNLLKSDQTPMYNFACVIDDHRMAMTHVLRGEDGISNTPRQLLLYKAFGWTAPTFGHVAFVLGPDGQKLSKRHGDTGVQAFRNKGYLPEALLNYLGLLGLGGEGEGEEIFSLDELVQRFSSDKLVKKASIFDYGKLDFLNAHWLRTKTGAQLAELAAPFLADLKGKLDLVKACEVFKGNAVHLTDLHREIAGLLVSPPGSPASGAYQAAKTAMNPWPADEAGFKAAIKAAQAASGIKGKDFFMPVRVAITGQEHGPELPKLLDLLGQDEVFRRLDAAGKGA